MPRIIHISQNETARNNWKTAPSVQLLVSDLLTCVGVVFKDEAGNISATHVDAKTDLAFIQNEAKYLSGKYTIDVVATKTGVEQSALAEEILTYIATHLGEIINSKGEKKCRITLTNAILLVENKMFSPQGNHVKELMLKYTGSDFSANNPLSKASLEENGKLYNLRLRERYLTTLFDPNSSLPSLIYDQGWTGNFVALSSIAKETMNAAKIIKNNQSFFAAQIKKAETPKANFKGYQVLDALPRVLSVYEQQKEIDVYSQLSLFNQSIHQPLAESILGHIANYAAPSEEERKKMMGM